MKIFVALLLFFTNTAFAQSSDFLTLKKKNKTVARYFAGSNIDFVTSSGAYYNVYINAIKSDTLYVQEFLVNRLPTTLGTYILDTVGSYHHKFHYKDLAAIGNTRKQGFNWKGSGAALLSGGALLTLGSGVVYVADRKKFSAPLLLSAVGLGALGYLLAKGRSDGITIGKKYRLVYMGTK